jgi:predicted O-methyltransferase YrrM
MLSISLRENEILRRLREETSSLPNSVMQISPDEGQFMALLVKLIGAKKTLEVGVFTGYSSLTVAQALPEDGILVACDINKEYTEVARRYWKEAKVDHKIDLRIAPAIETLEHLISNGESGSFDFAFLDADKDNYVKYYELALKLIRTGGLIAIDNVLWSGKVTDPLVTDLDTETIRKLNAFIKNDDRVDISLIAIGDGLTLCRKK